jgi:hypothetical protein
LKCLRKVALVSNLVISEKIEAMNYGNKLQTAIETRVNRKPASNLPLYPVGPQQPYSCAGLNCSPWFPVPAFSGKENGSMGLIDEL